MKHTVNYRKNPRPRTFSMALVLIIFAILSTNLLPVITGQSNDDAPVNNENQDEGPNGELEQNGTCNQTQTQQQNGTCNQTQQQNGTCNQTQNQTQQQNGTGNKIQEQNQQQDGTGNSSSYGYEHQYKQQGSNSEYQWRHQYRNEIQSGAENGTIPLEATFTYRNRHMVHENNHYQSGIELELDEAEGNKVQLRVRAEYHEGKVVVINIEGNVLRFRNGEGAKVYFDGKQIQQGSINEIMNAKGEQAKYVGVIGEGGAQFLVYIPHFSEHTITIESLIDQAKEELFTSTNYMVIGIGILALIGLTGYIFKIGKGRE